MTDRPKNVIFITIDALRFDRLSVNGYARPTTPTLERLANNALICRNHFTDNASTMGAFPCIMTSSRPLSYGGFDGGVFDRPPTIFQQMNAAGYETHMLSTVHWVNRFFGYGEGIDSEEMLFSLSSLIGTTGALTRTSIERHQADKITNEELLSLIGPVIENSLDQLEQYVHERLSRHHQDKRDFRFAPFFADGFDFRRILKTVTLHRSQYRNDPAAYISLHMPAPFRSNGWLSPIWRKHRQPWRLVEEIVEEIRGRILGFSDARWQFLHRQRYKRYPDADALVDHVLKTVTTRQADKPFCLWTHFFDTHLPYCAGSQPAWYRKSATHLEALGYDPSIDPGLTFGKAPKNDRDWQHWNALYDATIHFVDSAIARLISGLEKAGLLQETLLVISGDHGEELGENNDISHHFRLYDYNTHVPLIFSGADIAGGDIDAFTTHLDIPPTITDLVGIPAHPDWEGDSALSDAAAARDHILMETFYGSPCDFDRRPLYFGVRDREFHLMWKEYRDPTDHLSPEGQQLYSVTADPRQQNNIYDESHPAVQRGKRLIAARMAEIPEISNERANAVINGLGLDLAGTRQ